MSDNQQPSNLMIRIAMPIVVLAVGIVGFIVLSHLREPPPRSKPKVSTPVVETEAVMLHTGGLEIAIDGLVVPHREVTLSAEVAGRIELKTAACRAGRFVYGKESSGDKTSGNDPQAQRLGTLLLQIDPRDYRLDVERLSDEVEQADASLEELKVDVANTGALMKLALEIVEIRRRDLARIENLTRNRVSTASQIDEAKGTLLNARDGFLKLSNLQSLLNTRRRRFLSELDNANALLEKSKLDLARTEIRSPIGGVVVRDLVEQDTYVQKGTPLVTIEDTSAVEVKCSLRMDELFWLWQQPPLGQATAIGSTPAGSRLYEIPKTPVTIEYRLSGRTYQWQGELTRYDGIGLDEVTRTVPCRVIVRNPTHVLTLKRPAGTALAVGPPALVRGMYVTVKIHATPRTPLLRVSERAVRPGKQIWIVRSGKLEVQKIHIARVVGEDVLVDATASKLKAGDRMVVSPLSGAKAGMAVQAARRKQEKPAT